MRTFGALLQTISSLPRYMEAGYSPLGRSPVVDALLADPLYMPVYANTVAETIKVRSQDHSLFSLSTAVLTAGGIPLADMPKEEVIKASDTVPDIFLKAFSSLLARKIYGHWLTFIRVHQEVEILFHVLSDEEKNWIRENHAHFFSTTQGNSVLDDFFTTDNPYPFRCFQLASRIDLAKLADCARKLSLIVDDLYELRAELAAVSLTEDLVWEENALRLFISQKQRTAHRDNADFFIDLGGFNQIHTHAGGTEGTRPLALHIDVRGNNTYHGSSFVQGCGFLGVGLLVSFSGHNTYHADSYSQGCGLFGVGFLVNMEGRNYFTLRRAGQSFALFGSSLLWGREGHNQYKAAEGMAQAASSTLGVAFLIDNQGHNSYTSGASDQAGSPSHGGIAQGGSAGVRAYPYLNSPSLYGGVSFLYIGGGNNALKAVWLAQGSAYFLGTGIVVAEGSNDTFKADYDSQGQGLHLAAGLLLKRGSHNRFEGGWGSLGTSGDRSLGMLLGIGGHNHYEATHYSIGSARKPKSIGIFIDIGGHNTYKFQKFCSARLQFPKLPTGWPAALFLEIGEENFYPKNADEFAREDGSQWGVENHSMGISTPSIGSAPVEALFAAFHAQPSLPFSFDPIRGWPNNIAYRPLMGAPQDPQQLVGEIAAADYERRRQIYEALDLMRFKDRTVNIDLSRILENPTTTHDDALQYAILWALRNREDLNLQPIRAALEAGFFTSECTRKMALSLIGTFWTPKSTPLLQQAMLQDPSEEIRYQAALALTQHLPDASMDILKKGAGNESEAVRYAIAKGLQERVSPSTLVIILPLLNDTSFYVRRAAGLTALSIGDKRGIPVILETLKYETLDMEENYGDTIYSQLATYLPVNFGPDKQAWINWWERTKNSMR